MTIDLESPVQLGKFAEAYVAPRHEERVTFSLLGGPLHKLGKRLGLVRGESNTVLLGIVIGWSLWVVLLAIALVRGVAADLFAMPVIASHLRLLVVIPLLFFAEAFLDPMVRVFVGSLVNSEIVPLSERPVLLSLIERVNRSTNSWLPDSLCLVIAIVLGSSGARVPSYKPAALDALLIQNSVIVAMNFFVAITIFRFLILRWCWRMVIWIAFLWRMSRLRLRLVATHSDRSGGLGGLEIVQQHLLPLILALSVLEAGALAEQLARGMPFPSVYPTVAFGMSVVVVLVYLPLFLFTPKLIETRHQGFFIYMSLALRYTSAFEKKWLGPDAPASELLGSGDLQSLADLTNSVNVVRDMRFIPAGMRLFWSVIVTAAIPLLPLWLFQYSLTDLLQKFVGRLLGG